MQPLSIQGAHYLAVVCPDDQFVMGGDLHTACIKYSSKWKETTSDVSSLNFLMNLSKFGILEILTCCSHSAQYLFVKNMEIKFKCNFHCHFQEGIFLSTSQMETPVYKTNSVDVASR